MGNNIYFLTTKFLSIMFCSATCVSATTIPLLTNLCELGYREDCPSKLVLIRCDIALPTGSDAAKATALDALLTAGTLGITGKLKNFVWGDPQYSDLQLADCDPSNKIVIGRDLTFEDFNAMDVDDANDPAPYYDRIFWETVTTGQIWNYGQTTCSGKLTFFMKTATDFITGKITAFQTDDRSQAGKCIEVKKGTVNFLGDPLGKFPRPYLDLSTVVGTTPSLKALYQ